MSELLDHLSELMAYLTPEEQGEVAALIDQAGRVWEPLPGPQTAAYESEADVLFYGGAAGGGKSDLIIGLALTGHSRSLVLRREGTQLQGIIDRLTEIMGGRDGYNGQERVWRLPDRRQIEFGAVKDVGDEAKYQGRPHDLVCFDEITHFLESQFRFLCGWLRTSRPGQRCRVVCTGNPPTDSDGQWVRSYWAAWLDPAHPRPAAPGELRWYAMVDGVEVERPDGEPFVHAGKKIQPRSRTFIPSRVQDNPFLLSTGYEATLQALPEPLRSQMLEGNFAAGTDDDPFQVCPTAWVEAAMERWAPTGRSGEMDGVGADIARGGRDKTIITPRYGSWFAEQAVYPGSATPDGAVAASLIIANTRDGAPIHVDVIGVGASPVDHLEGNGVHVVPICWSESATRMDRTGKLRFVNLRAQHWWAMREALDPATGDNLALPPSPQLKADLTAVRWMLRPRGIQIESKDELQKRIGRSPDHGDSAVLALICTPKRIDDRDDDRSWRVDDTRSVVGGY